MPRELKLTWIAALKQWRKLRTVNGKCRTYYLGSGAGKSDRASYARALAKWHEIERDLDLAERGDELRQLSEAWRNEMLSRPGIDPSIYLPPTPRPIDPSLPLSASMQRWLDGTARMGEDRFARLGPVPAPEKTLGQAIGDYIEARPKD